MKRSVLFPLLALLLMQGLSGLSVQAAGDTLSWCWEVTTTTSTKTKSVVLEYTGSLQFDWGDGVMQTYADSLSGKTLSHVYSVVGNHRCKVMAASLTYFKADSRKLLELHPQLAPNLSYLSVTSNQLTTLNLSANTALTSLYVGSNDLTVLDLANCRNLQTLTCSDNLLKTIDVSAVAGLRKITCHTNPLASLKVPSSGGLNYVSCHTCSLDVAALDSLFSALPVLASASTSKNLFVLDNPGTAGCRISVATAKRWTPDKGLTTGTLFVNDAVCVAGDSVQVDVVLENPLPVVAFEANLTLPAGVVLDTVRSALTARKGNHVLSVSSIGTRQYKLLSWSMTPRDCYAGSTGAIVRLFLKTSAISGSLPIALSNAVMVDTASVAADFITMDGVLTVNPVRRSGDVNGDSTVDVTDITCLVAHIYGRKVSGFDPYMADLDGNGVWNVVDITRMVNLINGTTQQRLTADRASRAAASGTSGSTVEATSSVAAETSLTAASGLRLYAPQAVYGGNHLFLRTSVEKANTLELCLENQDSIQAFQTDVCVPEGFELDEQSLTGSPLRFNGQTLLITPTGSNSYRLLCFAYRPDRSFSGVSGPLVHLPMRRTASSGVGPYPFRLEHSVLTRMDLTTAILNEYDCLADLQAGNEGEAIKAGGASGYLWVQGSGIRSVQVIDASGRKCADCALNGSCRFEQKVPAGVYLVCAVLESGEVFQIKVPVP